MGAEGKPHADEESVPPHCALIALDSGDRQPLSPIPPLPARRTAVSLLGWLCSYQFLPAPRARRPTPIADPGGDRSGERHVP